MLFVYKLIQRACQWNDDEVKKKKDAHRPWSTLRADMILIQHFIQCVFVCVVREWFLCWRKTSQNDKHAYKLFSENEKIASFWCVFLFYAYDNTIFREKENREKYNKKIWFYYCFLSILFFFLCSFVRSFIICILYVVITYREK